MDATLAETFTGLTHWQIDPAQAVSAPLLTTAQALDKAVLREMRSPTSAWSEQLREDITELAGELKTFEASGQSAGKPFSPAVQMSLVVAAINNRTGFTGRFALGQRPRDIAKPLRPAHLAVLPAQVRSAILHTETALDRLAADFVTLRSGIPGDAPTAKTPEKAKLRPV